VVPARQINGEVPPELDRILGKCLEKDASERYQDTRDLVVDLRRLKRELESQPLARPEEPAAVPAVAPGVRWRGWRRLLVASGAVVVLAAMAVLAWRLWPSAPPAPPELKQRPLTANPTENPVDTAALSPDGRLLAYLDGDGVHVRTVDTGETQTLALPEEFWKRISALNWFPDGTRLLAADDGRDGASGGIWAFSLLGGSPRKLRDDLGVRAWGESAGASPDGSRIAFLRGRGVYGTGREIWVMDSDGSDARQIATAAEGSEFSSVQWSPDGRRIADILTRGTRAPITTIIESRPAEGGEATPIFSDTKLLSSFCWLADGRLLYARAEDPGWRTADMRLWEIRVDPATGRPSSEPRLLASWAGLDIAGLNASHDGRRLVFMRAQAGTDVHVGELEDGGRRLRQPRRLTLDERSDGVDGWTRDSRTVLLTSNRGGTWDVFRQGLDQQTAELVAGGPDRERGPHQSPDGEWILYGFFPRECQGDQPRAA
jgi:Tol biopolymer transport system component